MTSLIFILVNLTSDLTLVTMTMISVKLLINIIILIIILLQLQVFSETFNCGDEEYQSQNIYCSNNENCIVNLYW